MVTLDEVAAITLALPDVTEILRHGNRAWIVGGKGFAWERPLNKADVKRLAGAPVPEGPLLAVRVSNLEEKEVLMMDPPKGFFDIEHFRGYPAVLIKLNQVTKPLIRTAIVEAWYACAPPRIAAAGPRRR